MKIKKTKPKNSEEDLTNMSLDTFLNHFEIQSTYDNKNPDDEESEDEKSANENDVKTEKSPEKKVKAALVKKPVIPKDDEDSDADLDPISHKKSLTKLKMTDPDFYNFLEENDRKLLDFDLDELDAEEDPNADPPEESDVDRDSGDDSDEDSAIFADGKKHKPKRKLEVASDESDFEPDEDDPLQKRRSDKGKITLKQLKTWREELLTDHSSKTICNVFKAFHAVLLRVSSDEVKEKEHCEYTVDGSAVFNGVIQICILDLQPALKRFLNITGPKQAPHKCKKWSKIKVALKSYLTDLFKLLSGVTSSNILTVLLKHIHQMSPMLVSFNTLAKNMLKRLIKIWGTQDDTVRVIAFLCILRMTNSQRASFLNLVLKKMYMVYVINAKFVSPSTLPAINFMRRSLVEMFALDLNYSYQHVFLYIRQLAIHLRNAITLKRKENIQAVYNWQYINSIHLWAELLAQTCHKPQLQQLLYPLVQICIGAVKLISTAQYYPLRFHCIEIMIELTKVSGVFIPILPFIYEVLTIYDFDKKHKKVSMKPIQFRCLLRLSKSQLTENGFKDAAIEEIYVLLLKYLETQSHSIAFPDLVLPCIFELKKFIKNCPVANYCKKMRQILDKIEENSKFIETARKTYTGTLADQKQIQAWETNIRLQETPLMKFYESWEKINKVQKKKKVTKNDEIGDYGLPVLNKLKRKSDDKDGPVELFPSDSEDDGEIPNLGPKPKRGKRGSKKQKTVSSENGVEVEDEGDIVMDADASEW